MTNNHYTVIVISTIGRTIIYLLFIVHYNPPCLRSHFLIYFSFIISFLSLIPPQHQSSSQASRSHLLKLFSASTYCTRRLFDNYIYYYYYYHIEECSPLIPRHFILSPIYMSSFHFLYIRLSSNVILMTDFI